MTTWPGRGATPVGAAVGAGVQHEVPVLDCESAGGRLSDATSVSARTFAVEKLRGEDGTIPATIIADADGAHRTLLELTIPSAP